MPTWAVATTHPQAEDYAADSLSRLGYRTYLPTYAARARHPRLRWLFRTVTKPLFPGYIFVRNPEPWTPIRYADGVRDVLMAGERPALCPAEAVEALQAGEASRRTPVAPGPLWAAGEACKLAAGGMVGQEGVITAVGSSTATVTLLILGALRDVTVPLDHLARR